ncbi:MAG: hypothetical protein QGF12_02865 [SAR202 cluster bacterium]|jgi:hypothetical protein|nr:hypothetical protein [SAR202 cluster bacterium]
MVEWSISLLQRESEVLGEEQARTGVAKIVKPLRSFAAATVAISSGACHRSASRLLSFRSPSSDFSREPPGPVERSPPLCGAPNVGKVEVSWNDFRWVRRNAAGKAFK